MLLHERLRAEVAQFHVSELGSELISELRTRVARHLADSAQHLAGLACHLRQPVRSEDEDRGDEEHQDLAPADVIEHGSSLTHGERARSCS
ncbi:MAG: hypothetical protein WKF73_01725 [Nocardioidaceae bacterium]